MGASAASDASVSADRFTHVVVNLDQLSGVSGVGDRVGHDHGHRIAHVAHGVRRTARDILGDRAGAVGLFHHGLAGEALDGVSCRPRQDQRHTVGRLGGF